MDTERVPLYFNPLDDNPPLPLRFLNRTGFALRTHAPLGFLTSIHPQRCRYLVNDNLPVLVRPSFGNLSVSFTLTPSLHPTSTHSATHHRLLVLQNHRLGSTQQSRSNDVPSAPPTSNNLCDIVLCPWCSGSHLAYYLTSSLLYQIILVAYLK